MCDAPPRDCQGRPIKPSAEEAAKEAARRAKAKAQKRGKK